MSSSAPSEAGAGLGRAANAAALPRMRATFPFQVMGEMGLNSGDVWWMDMQEVMFWCNESLQVDLDMRARVDLRNGRTIDVAIRLLKGEAPFRHNNGYLHIALWKPTAQRDARIAEARLREVNPEAFGKDYRSPRLPEARAESVTATREPGERELMAQRHARDMAEVDSGVAAATRRRWRVRLTMLAVGMAIGGSLAITFDDASSARLLAYRRDPAQALRYGLLRGANFSGEDLDGAELAHADARDANLVGASLVGANLAEARLTNSDLRRADLTRARLGRASLVGARLEGAVLRGADLRGADVAADPAGADFLGAIYSNETIWQNGRAAVGAIGPGAIVDGIPFDALVAEGLDLHEIHGVGSRMLGAKFAGTTLTKADFSRAVLDAADLRKAELADATLASTQCSNCLFTGAHLDRVKAGEAMLEAADLSATTADQPDFRGATLRRANLSATTWTQPDLRQADLSAANLSGAQWSGCWLLGANLGSANLAGSQLGGCVSDEHTVWPEGSAAWNYGVLVLSAEGNSRGVVLPQGVDLSNRDLRRLKAPRMTAVASVWTDANLEAADLSNTGLEHAVFDGANLRGANFSGADLTAVRFLGTDLAGVNFAQAKLCDADFVTADLTGAKFDRATACTTTRWPRNKPPKGISLR